MKRTYLEFILEGVEDIVGQLWSDFGAVSVSTHGTCYAGQGCCRDMLPSV